jgi:hypothetical protein
LNASLNEEQERFATLVRDPRLTPSLMLEVMNDAMGLQPDLRLALPHEARKAPVGSVGMIAAWPAGALARAVAANGLGPLCDAIEEHLALLSERRRFRP